MAMARISRGIVLTVIGGLCGATLVAIGSAWGQPPRARPVPVPAENNFVPAQRGQPIFGEPVGPNDGFSVPQPVEADQFMIETNELIDAYRQSSDEKIRAGLRNKLTAVLAKKFDSQHQRREQEITELKARLKQLTELHTKRTAERKGIIERHAERLLREIDGLGWEIDAPPTWEYAPSGA
jgi:hypothetical protein